MMKIAATSMLLVLCAVSSSAFSITMSSYLDQLNRAPPATTSSSYSYGSSAPSPASYTTPYSAPAPVAPSSYSYGGPPAPAPYVSAFANMPANKDLNYLITLGGGSKKKWGADYSGVSSTFRPIQSVGYLENLQGVIMSSSSAPAPAPAYSYASSWAQPAAPAPAPATSYSYGSSAPAPAPYVSSFAPSPASGSSAPKSTSSYLSSL